MEIVFVGMSFSSKGVDNAVFYRKHLDPEKVSEFVLIFSKAQEIIQAKLKALPYPAVHTKVLITNPSYFLFVQSIGARPAINQPLNV